MNGIQTRLHEIDYIRATVITILIGYHCLAPYCGAWELPSEYSSSVLLWIGKFLYNGMLETFVFISGYLCAASWQRKGTPQLGSLIKSKLKRLYVPCLCWGIVMTVLFHQENSLSTTLQGIANGRNHLWFLPMLFWCFVLELLLIRIRARQKRTLAVLAVIAILPYFGIPLQFNNSLYYLFFFHFGTVVFYEKENIEGIVAECWRKLIFGGGNFNTYPFRRAHILANNVFQTDRSKLFARQSNDNFL